MYPLGSRVAGLLLGDDVPTLDQAINIEQEAERVEGTSPTMQSVEIGLFSAETNNRYFSIHKDSINAQYAADLQQHLIGASVVLAQTLAAAPQTNSHLFAIHAAILEAKATTIGDRSFNSSLMFGQLCVWTPLTTTSEPQSQQREDPRDIFTHVARAAVSGVGSVPLRTRIRVCGLLIKLIDQCNGDPTILMAGVDAAFSHESVTAVVAQTAINWAARLVLQRAIVEIVRELVPNGGALVRDQDNQRSDDAVIIQRARNVRDILNDEALVATIQARILGQQPLVAWAARQQPHVANIAQLLRLWAVCGLHLFTRTVLHLARGGRTKLADDGRHDAVTMDTLSPVINRLRKEPQAHVSGTDGVVAHGETLQPTGGLSSGQVYTFLNRLGIKRQTAHAVQASALRVTSKMEARRFRRLFQDVYTIGDTADCVWMDETTLTLSPSQTTAWGFSSVKSSVLADKRAGRGGQYNMMLTVGCIGRDVFIHYAVYKPQRDRVVMTTPQTTPLLFVELGTRRKVMGNYGSILNYLFGHWKRAIPTLLAQDISLMDAVAQMRRDSGRDGGPVGLASQIPCFFVWDNLGAHFNQTVRAGAEATFRGPFNPSFDVFKTLLPPGVSMVHTPRYAPQFNPCERVFAHLKAFITTHWMARRTDQRADHINEPELITLIADFFASRPDDYVCRVARACMYRITPGGGQPPIPVPIKQQVSPDEACNDPGFDPHTYDVTGLDRRSSQLVCACERTGLISKALAPRGGDSWRVLAPASVLFDKQKPYIIERFENFFDVGNTRGMPLWHYFPVYTGYAMDVFYDPVRGPDRLINEIDTSAECSMFVADVVHSGAFPDGEQQQVMVQNQYMWQAIVLLSRNPNWVLITSSFKHLSFIVFIFIHTGNRMAAVAVAGRTLQPASFNFYVGRVSTSRDAVEIERILHAQHIDQRVINGVTKLILALSRSHTDSVVFVSNHASGLQATMRKLVARNRRLAVTRTKRVPAAQPAIDSSRPTLVVSHGQRLAAAASLRAIKRQFARGDV